MDITPAVNRIHDLAKIEPEFHFLSNSLFLCLHVTVFFFIKCQLLGQSDNNRFLCNSLWRRFFGFKDTQFINLWHKMLIKLIHGTQSMDEDRMSKWLLVKASPPLSPVNVSWCHRMLKNRPEGHPIYIRGKFFWQYVKHLKHKKIVKTCIYVTRRTLMTSF